MSFSNKPLATLVALACAQAAVAKQPVTLDEVVVTATRTTTPVAKVLSDVTVLGSPSPAASPWPNCSAAKPASSSTATAARARAAA